MRSQVSNIKRYTASTVNFDASLSVVFNLQVVIIHIPTNTDISYYSVGSTHHGSEVCDSCLEVEYIEEIM